MITCTFIGYSSVIESDFWTKVIDVLEPILEKDQEFTFLFTVYTPFTAQIRGALLKLNDSYPQKKLVQVLVQNDTSCSKFAPIHENYFDELTMPLGKIEGNVDIIRYRLYKWCIDQSDYLISNVYDILHCSDNKVFLYAQKKKCLRSISINTPETREFFLSHLQHFSERDQYIFMRFMQHSKIREIAASLGLSMTTVRVRYIKMSFQLIAMRARQIEAIYPNFSYKPALRGAYLMMR